MIDKRLGKGLDRNRFLLYVSDNNKALLDKLLEKLPPEKVSSLSSAIFVAIKSFVENDNA